MAGRSAPSPTAEKLARKISEAIRADVMKPIYHEDKKHDLMRLEKLVLNTIIEWRFL